MREVLPASNYLGIRGSTNYSSDEKVKMGLGGTVAFIFLLAALSGLSDGDSLVGSIGCLVIGVVCSWFGVIAVIKRKNLAEKASEIAEKFALSGQDEVPFSSVHSGQNDMSSDAFVRMLLQKRIMRNVMVDEQNGCFVLLREPMQVPRTMPPVQVVSVPGPTVVTIPTMQTARICPMCGTSVDIGARFCTSCGRPFVCHSCGHELLGAEAFCPNCGNSVR